MLSAVGWGALDEARDEQRTPLVVGIGGTTRAGSTTELAVGAALRAAEQAGARTHAFGGAFLARLPLYAPERGERTEPERELVEVVRRADALVIGSPGYHGGVSGLVKNALDLLEDLRDDARPYLQDRAVGCVVNAYGWQACGTTLVALRSIVHALRGWPTPLGATLNTIRPLFGADGSCTDGHAAGQLSLVGQQAVRFTRVHTHLPAHADR